MVNKNAQASFSELISAAIKDPAALADLSRTSMAGFCPSNRQVVTQHICDAERSLKEYDSEIQRVRDLLDSLMRERKRLSKTIAICKSFFAPVNRVPREIMEEIMLLAVTPTEIPLESSDNFKLSSRKTPAAMVLSMVSARWRDVALSSPDMWSHIKIQELNGFDRARDGAKSSGWPRGAAIIRALRLILKRSGSRLLGLRFNTQSFGPQASQFWFGDNMHTLLGMLAAESYRWQSVTFGSSSTLLNHPALCQVTVVPTLQHLRFNASADGIPISASKFLQSCHALETLKIWLWSYQPTFPWSEMREVRAHYTKTEFLMRDILRSCRSLRKLGSNYPFGDSQGVTGTPIISSLKSLTLYQTLDDLSVNRRCLEGITLPQLKALTLTHSSFLEVSELTWDESPLMALLERSPPNITSFTVRGVPIRDEQLIQALRHMPALQTLEIDQYKLCDPEDDTRRGPPIITTRLSASLSVPSLSSTLTPTLLVPHLKHLRVQLYGEDLDTKTFSQVIASRWIPDPAEAQRLGVRCLKSVEITFMGDFDEDDEIPVSDDFLALEDHYRDSGLEFHFEWPWEYSLDE